MRKRRQRTRTRSVSSPGRTGDRRRWRRLRSGRSRATFTWWSASAAGSVKFASKVKCLYTTPVLLSTSAVSGEAARAWTTTQSSGGGTSFNVSASLLRSAPCRRSPDRVVVTTISCLSDPSSSRSLAAGVSAGVSTIRLRLTEESAVAGPSRSLAAGVSAGVSTIRLRLTGESAVAGRTEASWRENREAVLVGAKPVKKPVRKHKAKWRSAFFHSLVLFLDRSKEPMEAEGRQRTRGERVGEQFKEGGRATLIVIAIC
ncbi:hypothetical protein MUK42_16846 [Musa troglodytarum]|uniref:Uncharacterized protein n=1 Tax=Musa troglodytarum TaxID=320322 RepID=A0A9E7I1J5_9LILI|nr:hypothetical protein MUK42_16846 [Musa troglodytarum]